MVSFIVFGFCVCSRFYDTPLCNLSNMAIISQRKRELVSFTSIVLLQSRCYMCDFDGIYMSHFQGALLI